MSLDPKTNDCSDALIDASAFIQYRAFISSSECYAESIVIEEYVKSTFIKLHRQMGFCTFLNSLLSSFMETAAALFSLIGWVKWVLSCDWWISLHLPQAAAGLSLRRTESHARQFEFSWLTPAASPTWQQQTLWIKHSFIKLLTDLYPEWRHHTILDSNKR